jgi:hypothetical protein
MCCGEPTLEEMLADPIVQAVMRADAVEEQEIEALLDQVAKQRRSAEARRDETSARPWYCFRVH